MMAYIMQSYKRVSRSGDGVISDVLITDKRYYGQPVVYVSDYNGYTCM